MSKIILYTKLTKPLTNVLRISISLSSSDKYVKLVISWLQIALNKSFLRERAGIFAYFDVWENFSLRFPV